MKIFYSHFYSISNMNIQVIARFIKEFHISCERKEEEEEEDKNCVKTTLKEKKRRELFKKEKKHCYFLIMSLYNVKAWSEHGMHVRKKKNKRMTYPISNTNYCRGDVAILGADKVRHE